MSERIGLVISGGGNRCGAAAGAVHALSVEHGIDDPYVIVCVSGGTEPALRYMAGRFREMYDWPRFVREPEISLPVALLASDEHRRSR